MSEEMQPIDPVTAAMLMGQVPEPCESITEISHKVLTKLLDVVEFGDQLERVEKDRLLAHLKEVLAADQPQLWAMHSPGPGEVHPVISKEEAERQQSELLALCKKQFPEISITVNVIPSPFSPLEHFEILAGELSEQVKHLQDYVKGLEGAAKALATDATLDKFRASGLSIDGDNAYKRDLLDAVVGAMMLGRHNTTPPPAGHWAQRFWDIGREYAELPGAIVLPMPVMPEQPKDAIDDSWMDAYSALRMREECQRAIEAAALAAPVVNQQLTTAAPSKTCTWELDWETGAYKLGCCDQNWHFIDGTAEENGAIFCHHCAGEIVADEPVLRAYQVGDNDIVAAYDPAGARKVLCEFNGYPEDQYEDSEVELVSDKVLDNTEAFDIDEGKTITLEKTLRQELAELTEPAYLHGWE